MARINKRTALKTIREMFLEDFGLHITNAQAKEVRASCVAGMTTWRGMDDPYDEYDYAREEAFGQATAPRYTSTCERDDIREATRQGVRLGGYRIFIPRHEWNVAVLSGNPPTW